MNENLKKILARQKILKQYLNDYKDTVRSTNYLDKKYKEICKYHIWEDLLFNKRDLEYIKKMDELNQKDLEYLINLKKYDKNL